MTRLTRRISSDFSYPIQAKLLETHPTYTAPVKRVFSLLISLNAVPPILSFSQNRRVLTEGVLHPRLAFSSFALDGISLFTVKFENVPGQSKLVNRITAFVYIYSEINRIFFTGGSGILEVLYKVICVHVTFKLSF